MAEPEKFAGLDLATRSRSIRTSGSTSRWIADVCCTAPRKQRKERSLTAANTHDLLATDPIEGFAFFEESLELSRRFRALKLWLSLRYHGLGAFRESIRKDLQQGRRLADAIKNEAKLELVAAGELSAVCFRHRESGSSSEERLNAVQCGDC